MRKYMVNVMSGLVLFLFIFPLNIVCTDGFRIVFGSEVDHCDFIENDIEGNFFVGGHTTGYGSSSQDLLFASFSSNGTMKWINSLGDPNMNETLCDMKRISDGHLVGVGRANLDEVTEYPLIVKVDSDTGAKIWANTQVSSDFHFSAVTEVSSNLWVVGNEVDGSDSWIQVWKIGSDGSFDAEAPTPDVRRYGWSGYNTEATVVSDLYDGDNILLGGWSNEYADTLSNKATFYAQIDVDNFYMDWMVHSRFDTRYEVPVGVFITSSTCFNMFGSDRVNKRIFGYHGGMAPSWFYGIYISHASGYDMEALGGTGVVNEYLLMVGKITIGSIDYGMMIKTDHYMGEIQLAVYFTDVESFHNAKRLPSGNVILTGRARDGGCLVAVLEDDFTLCDFTTAVDIEGDLALTFNDPTIEFGCYHDPGNTAETYSSFTNPSDYTLTENKNPPHGQDYDCLSCYGIHSGLGSVCTGSDNGYCSYPNHCQCNPGYYSSECEDWECFSHHKDTNEGCTYHGTCDKPNNCNCETGYTIEPDCHLWECYFNFYNDTVDVCSGRGNCTAPNNCSCPTGWVGDDCELIDIFCDSIHTWNETVCSGNGNCTDNENCVCKEGYYPGGGLNEYCDSFYCFGEQKDSDVACNFGNGTCIEYNNCSCNLGYSGEECKDWYCEGIHHSNDSHVCTGRGSCVRPGVCKCEDTFVGDYCQYFTCYGISENEHDIVCGGHGECTPSGTCICDDWYGNYSIDCSVWKCWGHFMNDTSEDGGCFGHGNCSARDICSCNQNYTGEDCNSWFCHGFERNEIEDVCSRHGDCISPEQCRCSGDTGDYVGERCEYYECYGIPHNLTAPVVKCDEDIKCACNGHGECIGHNNCSCDSQYPGFDCGILTCYGVLSTDYDNACGLNGTGVSFGVCVELDTCFCFPGYGSVDLNGPCTEWFCGQNHREDDEVCTGMGDCVSSQFCECRDGYEGPYCDTWSCGADYKLKEVTCSGNGKCVAPNDCECKSGYRGELCKENMYYYYVMAPVLSGFGLTTLLIVLGLVLCVFCVLCTCCCIVCFGIVFLSCLVGVVYIQKTRMKKFGKLKNIDILIREQELEEDESVAHISINKKLFEIPFKELSLEKVIGSGGSSSVVYRATWRKQVIAFKSFKTRHVCSDQDSFDEFEAEVTVLSSVSHPNIIRFFGGTLQPPRVGIVMEYCDNGDMAHFLGKYTKDNDNELYPLEEKVRMIHEVASAMDYLHSRNILHRDIKTENVLIDLNENCKLMDFGLSKIVERISRAQTRSVGTSIYMSPEIVLTGHYGPSTDVFSFGILMFICLTQNENPYGPTGQGGMLEVRVANDENMRPDVNELEEVMDEGDFWLKDLMVECWRHNAEERPLFNRIMEVIEEKTVVEEALEEMDDEMRLKAGTLRSLGSKSGSRKGNRSRKLSGLRRVRKSEIRHGRTMSMPPQKKTVGKDDDNIFKEKGNNEVVVESHKKKMEDMEEEINELKKKLSQMSILENKNKALVRQLFQKTKKAEKLERILKTKEKEAKRAEGVNPVIPRTRPPRRIMKPKKKAPSIPQAKPPKIQTKRKISLDSSSEEEEDF